MSLRTPLLLERQIVYATPEHQYDLLRGLH